MQIRGSRKTESQVRILLYSLSSNSTCPHVLRALGREHMLLASNGISNVEMLETLPVGLIYF